MARILSLVPLAAACLAAGVSPARCETPAAPADPIASELTKPSAGQAERVFNPVAISDLLAREGKKDAPASITPALPANLSIDIAARGVLTPAGMQVVHFKPVSASARAVDPVVLKAEILLDRNHAPPGVIDGRFGNNVTKAVITFELTHGLTPDGKLTQVVWDALGGDNAAPVLTTYTIKPEDLVGPFYPDLPTDYALLAKLPTAGFHSPLEMFGERFHMDKRFLQALNTGVDFGVAGSTIVVADIASLPLVSKVARIDVDKAKGQVLAYDAQDNLIVAYPATIGSEELPSPSGSYAVRGVAWKPTYSYDPKKNFQQGTNTERLTLPPGPNNPVGAVFIALTKPTFGIHGTPDPTKIDKTHSHGCVRLTNWNAQELAGLVKAGVPVNFLDKPGAETPVDDIAAAIASEERR